MIVIYDMFRQKSDGVRIQDVSAHTSSPRLYKKMWEHVA